MCFLFVPKQSKGRTLEKHRGIEAAQVMAENASMSTANIAFSSIIFMLFIVVVVEVVGVVAIVVVVLVSFVVVCVVVCGPQLSGFRTSHRSCMTKSC